MHGHALNGTVGQGSLLHRPHQCPMDILQRRQKRWQGVGARIIWLNDTVVVVIVVFYGIGIRRRQHQPLDSIGNRHGLRVNLTYRSIRHCRHQNPLLHLHNRQNQMVTAPLSHWLTKRTKSSWSSLPSLSSSPSGCTGVNSQAKPYRQGHRRRDRTHTGSVATQSI